MKKTQEQEAQNCALELKMSKANRNKKEQDKRSGFARSVNALLSGRYLTREYVQSNLAFILFVVGMMVCYIAYGYYAESNMKEMVAAEAELQQLKSRNLAAQAKLSKLRAQSTVEDAIKDLGLHESTTPPIIIQDSNVKTPSKKKSK